MKFIIRPERGTLGQREIITVRGALISHVMPAISFHRTQSVYLWICVIEGHPILFLSREKVRKNKIFKNNELKTGPLFRNTSPSESVDGFLFGFDESLAHNEL
jgi:hypothetical protein